MNEKKIMEEFANDLYKLIGRRSSIEAELAAAMFIGDLGSWSFTENKGVVTGVENQVAPVTVSYGLPYMSFFDRFIQSAKMKLQYFYSAAQFDFDYNKFKAALSTFDVSTEQIEEIIDSKVQKYRALGYEISESWIANFKLNLRMHQEDLKVTIMLLEEHNKAHADKPQHDIYSIPSIAVMRQKYAGNLKERIAEAIKSDDISVVESAVKIAIIAEIEIYNKKAIDYAIEHNIEIDGMNPIEFVILRNIKDSIPATIPFRIVAAVTLAIRIKGLVHGMDPLRFALQGGVRIDGKNPIAYAVEKGIMIEGSEPIQFALNNAYNIDGKNPIEWAMSREGVKDQTPLEFAVINGYKIDGKDALEIAYLEKHQILGESAIIWAAKNGKILDGLTALQYAALNNKADDLQQIIKVLYDKDKEAVLADLIDLHKWYHNKIGAVSPVIEVLYNDLIKEINKDSEVITLENTKFDKASAYTIARKVDKVMERQDRFEYNISASDLLKRCDFQMALKIVEIGQDLQYTKDHPYKSSIYAAFDAICECFKKIFMSNADRVRISDVYKLFEELVKTEKSEDVDIKNQSLKTFAERASVERSSDNAIER